MTHVITSACIDGKYQSCLAVCPVDCIVEADRMFVIDPTECIDCGACESECPVEAIFPDEDLPAAERVFLAINALVRQGVDEVDAAVERYVERGALVRA